MLVLCKLRTAQATRRRTLRDSADHCSPLTAGHPAQVLCELPALQTAQGAAAWGQLLQATLKALEQRSEQESAQEAPPEALEDIAEETQG